jgi:hypothetical protein
MLALHKIKVKQDILHKLHDILIHIFWKGQSHEKVCKIITLNKGSPPAFSILKPPF